MTPEEIAELQRLKEQDAREDWLRDQISIVAEKNGHLKYYEGDVE